MPAEIGVRRNALKKQRRSRGASVSLRVQVSEMQRARLLSAAVATIDELGYARASVAHITARARVSRRTFYDLFASREDCLLAVLRDAAERITGEIAAQGPQGLAWRERVRGGLFAILSFLDREPVLARVCVVQSLQGGPRVLAWREHVLAQLAQIIDEGRAERPRSPQCTALTAEGLVGAAFAIVYARLSPVSTVSAGRGEAPPLVALLGELMSLIVLPYLGSAAAQSEQRRGIGTFSFGRKEPAGLKSPARLADISGEDPLREVPMRLTYRTARVLQAVAENPGASNRHIGEQADLYDQGQISKLLGRLERIGLLVKSGVGHTKGEANAWRLTALGERVTRQLSLGTRQRKDDA
jgi:AcrR family transcriptional regulator/DNA-binding MarR family transcriptional regulator